MSGLNIKKPSWLRRSLPSGSSYERIRLLLKGSGLNTVCHEACCPNIFECFSSHTAAFLIMGPVCTRNCRFCAIGKGKPDLPDPKEPARVATVAGKMNLKYVVVTSVARDDLSDGGASIFEKTIYQIKRAIKDVTVEVLIPDFQGSKDALKRVLTAEPDVLNHNIETVCRLYPLVRPMADYKRSLCLLRTAKEIAPHIPVKSGIMLGLGETSEEIMQSICDLYDSGCRILTIGQYLQPSKAHLAVKRYVHPEEFDSWRKTALMIGFDKIASGPFIRSSFHAKEIYYGDVLLNYNKLQTRGEKNAYGV